MKLGYRWAVVMGMVAASGCGELTTERAPGPAGESERPKVQLETHAVMPSTPTPQGVVYLEAVAAAHARADAATDREVAIRELRQGLALPVPGDMGEAAIVRLELATRLCETLAERSEGVPAALEMLMPMLAPTRSLPLDRTAAEALVTLGDLAHRAGDDVLAVESYARAIRMMSLLRQELQP